MVTFTTQLCLQTRTENQSRFQAHAEPVFAGSSLNLGYCRFESAHSWELAAVAEAFVIQSRSLQSGKANNPDNHSQDTIGVIPDVLQ